MSSDKPKFEDSWIKFLDWSKMKYTWDKIPMEGQKVILEKGFWSRGKGNFVPDADPAVTSCSWQSIAPLFKAARRRVLFEAF